MRKLTTGIIVGVALATGAAGTVAIVGTSSSDAAPPPLRPQYCGQFAGRGPAPSCSYVADRNTVVIFLRNNGYRRTPVRCDLFSAGRQYPLDSTILGPGRRGSVSAGLTPRVPRSFLVSCRSLTRGYPEVDRRVRFTVAPPRPTFTPPKRPTTTHHRPPTRQRPPEGRPTRNTHPIPTPTTTTTTTTVRPTGAPRPQTSNPRPHNTTTTTTTTTAS